MRRAKAILANSALALASMLATALVIVAGGEALLRWQYGSVEPGPPNEWRRYDAQRGWALEPGRYVYLDIKAMRRVEANINELGLRNGPLSPEERPGVERVTVIGDSFVFGPPVNDGDTITARLQQLAGQGYEVVNVAVPGYGTGQQYRLVEELQAKGYRLGRKVVLVFFTNDIQDNVGLEYATLEPNVRQPAFSVDSAGQLQHTPTRPWASRAARPTGAWYQRSLFIPYLRYQAEVVFTSYPGLLGALEALGVKPSLPRTPGVVAGWYGEGWEHRWQTTEAVLEHVISRLQALPEPPELSIAFVPSPFQVQEAFRRVIANGAPGDARYASFLADPDRPQRLVEAVAKRRQVRFIDLTPALRRAAESDLVYFPREGHFTEAGCALAANIIYRQVIRKENGHGV